MKDFPVGKCFHCYKDILLDEIKIDINVLGRGNSRSVNGLLFHVECFKNVAGEAYLKALLSEILDKNKTEPLLKKPVKVTVSPKLRKLKITT